MSIEFLLVQPELPESKIDQLQKKLRTEIPENVRQFIRTFHGRVVAEPVQFRLTEPRLAFFNNRYLPQIPALSG